MNWCSSNALAIGLCLAMLGCNTVKVTHQDDFGTVPAGRPAIVYVADFDLDVGDIRSGSGMASMVVVRPLGGGILPHPFGLLPQSKETTLDNLPLGPPQPFYQLDTTAQSGKMPGAMVTMKPAVAATRFVLAGGDLHRNTKDTAAQIATSVAVRVPT